MSTTGGNFEHDIFLSYNSKDQQWVTNLAERLESEKTNERQIKVFFDIWDIKPGENIVNRIEDGLTKSRFVAIVLSKNSINAEWPNMEWTIAISSDPSGRKGTVIPIWLGDCDIPSSLKIRNVLYCRNNKEFETSYKKLIAILAEKKLPRGEIQQNLEYHEKFPLDYEDPVSEQLASNLLPMISMPSKIFSGPTDFSSFDIFENLKSLKGIHPTYIVKEKRIYTFWDLNDNFCPFRRILSANAIEIHNSESWLKDKVKEVWLVELLNRALKSHAWNLNLRMDSHKRFFFLPYGGTDRNISWNTGKRKATRTVTASHKRSNGDVFWSHQALRARFILLNEAIFLLLTPSWTFTIDGENPVPSNQMVRLTVKWNTKEFNPSVFYHVRFWSNVLSQSKSKIELQTGGEKCVIDTNPAVIELNAGIYGDQNPIDKVFEIADEEITASDIERDMFIKDEDNNE